MLQARIALPKTAVAKGEVVEVKTLISHPMETGFRRDNVGKRIPRNILQEFICFYNQVEVFHAHFFPSIAANPYLSFYIEAIDSGAIACHWIDQHGQVTRASKMLHVQS